jgi:integrase
MASIQERPTKDGTVWRVQIRKKGFANLDRTFDSEKEAKDWVKKTEGKSAPAPKPGMKAAEKITLADGLTKYLNEVVPKKKGSKQEEVRIKAWLKRDIPGLEVEEDKPVQKLREGELDARKISNLSLVDITSEMMAAYIDERIDEDGVSGSTVRNEVSIISSLFELYQRKWGLRQIENPMARVWLPDVNGSRERRLEPGEMELLLPEAEKKHPEMPFIIQLLVETAMRRSELLLIERSRVVGNIAHLLETKNGSKRDVPLSSLAMKLFSEMPVRNDGKIFSLSPQTVSNYMPIISRAAGTQGLRLHDLRHEAISRLFEMGLSIMEVKLISGHKTTKQLEKYLHLRPKDVAKKLL